MAFTSAEEAKAHLKIAQKVCLQLRLNTQQTLDRNQVNLSVEDAINVCIGMEAADLLLKEMFAEGAVMAGMLENLRRDLQQKEHAIATLKTLVVDLIAEKENMIAGNTGGGSA